MKTAGAAAILSLAASTSAVASGSAASLTLATDRIWRGLSQTEGAPALIGEAKWSSAAGPLVGLWISNYRSDQSGGAGLTILPFVAFNRTVAGINFDGGYLYHANTGAGRRHDFSEITLSTGFGLGVVRTRIGAFYGWDSYLGGRTAYLYADGCVKLATVDGIPLSLLGHVGRFDAAGSANDYADGRLALSAKLPHVTFEAALSRSSIDAVRARLDGSRYGGTRFALSAFTMF